MKPYEELTRLGRLRRLRQLGEAALKEYGLSGSKLTFLHYEGNVIFRVDVPGKTPTLSQDGIFLDNRYVLRILTTSNYEGTLSESTFLAAMRREAGLPVPEPVPTLDGKLLTKITIPGVPSGKLVSMMRWMDGRQLTKGFHPGHFRAWGHIIARLHNFSAGWQPPEGFTRPHWDWEGQLGGREFRSTSIEELVDMMPAHYREPFSIVSAQVKDVMETFGKEPDAYGMIHADMYPENVLFRAGEVRPIDFEDCGYGYWLWDVAVALCLWPWTEDWHWKRDALLDGYAKTRTLPDAQLKHLDLFMEAQYATMVLWATLFIKVDPAMRAEHEAWRDKDAKKLLHYFDTRS